MCDGEDEWEVEKIKMGPEKVECGSLQQGGVGVKSD